ncbi:MAG TPA: hypoxanthine phosphoribosyltransferase [Candidatus Polarisedimenticolia bacterium]|nr:hypoxanthine phosphoribosyltransferase [Candidatus Polarisedimenticolia bacterium]
MNVSREVLKNEAQIAERVRALGREITEFYRGEEISLLGILKGSFIFMADLAREIRLPAQVGFLEIVTSRKSEFLTEVAFSSSFPIEGSHVLVVEDILDTGVTLAYLSEQLQLHAPKSLKICTFLDKPHRRKVDLTPDFVGFEVPDRHVVGYGLDYQGKHRNLPHLTFVE